METGKRWTKRNSKPLRLDKETQGVPNGRLGAESDLSGDRVGIEKMEHADPELAAGDESLYYRVR